MHSKTLGNMLLLDELQSKYGYNMFYTWMRERCQGHQSIGGGAVVKVTCNCMAKEWGALKFYYI